MPKGKSWLGGGGGRAGEKEVVMDQDFYLGKYEVTQREWMAVTGDNPSVFSRNGGGRDQVAKIPDSVLERFRVEHVSWDNAQLFLERLNRTASVAGWVYRLPTKVEWEYACRGGPLNDKSESAYYFYFDKPANELSPEQANFRNQNWLKHTCQVGSYTPNRLGLFDMHGNVWEMCADAGTDLKGTPIRFARGGSWYFGAKECEAGHDLKRPPWHRLNERGLGLRVALTLVDANRVTVPQVSITKSDIGLGLDVVRPRLSFRSAAPSP